MLIFPRLVWAASALALPLLGVSPRAEPFSVAASVETKQLALGDTLVVDVEVTGVESEPNVDVKNPETKDFAFLGRWTSHNTSITLEGDAGGAISESQVVHVELAATHVGHLRLPPFQATHAGQVFATKPLELEVVARPNRLPRRDPRAPTDRFAFGAERDASGLPPDLDTLDAFLSRARAEDLEIDDACVRLEVDKKVVRVGEPVTVSVYLVSTDDVYPVRTPRLAAPPGFQLEPLPSREAPTPLTRRMGDHLVSVLRVARYTLRSTTPGWGILQAMEVDYFPQPDPDDDPPRPVERGTAYSQTIGVRVTDKAGAP